MEYLGMTVAALIAWLTTTGVAALVGDGLNWLHLSPQLKRVCAGVLIAALTALVTAVGNELPQEVLNQTVFDVIVAALAAFSAWAGQYLGRAVQTDQEVTIQGKVGGANTLATLADRQNLI
jgi:hypothetical protein